MTGAERDELAAVRHDIGNALAIVQANLEGMIDGLIPASTDSLTAIHAAIVQAGAVLERLRRLTSEAGRE